MRREVGWGRRRGEGKEREGRGGEGRGRGDEKGAVISLFDIF